MRVDMIISITPTEEEVKTINAFAKFLDELEIKIECYEHNADQEKAEYTLSALREGLDDLEELLHDLENDDNTGVIIE